jgi:hypothetical protein
VLASQQKKVGLIVKTEKMMIFPSGLIQSKVKTPLNRGELQLSNDNENKKGEKKFIYVGLVPLTLEAFFSKSHF